MLTLTPQFAALLVALTATAVQAAPHQGQHHRGRRGFDAEISSVDLHSQLARRLAARHFTVARREASEWNTESVYIAPPASHALGKDESHSIDLASLSESNQMRRRDLDDPIDEPDPQRDEHAGGKTEKADEPEGHHRAGHEGEDDESGGSQRHRRYHIDSVNGPGLVISHAQAYGPHMARRSHTVAIYDVHRRGLLDPLIPILGSLPGVGGIISIIADTVGGVLNGLPILGPILGDLLLSPHKPVTAQGVNDTAPAEYFLDASSSRNGTTIHLVDCGRPSAFAIASQTEGNNNTMYERLVSLQMAFVNSETGKLEAYCATFKGAETGSSEPAALAALPCITDGMTEPPHPSQLWGYNPANHAVRPMWDEAQNGGAGKRRMRRAYVVKAAGGDNATLSQPSEAGMDSVVLVFKPWEMDNSTYTGPTYDPKELGNWQAPEGNTTTDGSGPEAGEADPEGAAAAEDVSEDDQDDGVPVFVAGAARGA